MEMMGFLIPPPMEIFILHNNFTTVLLSLQYLLLLYVCLFMGMAYECIVISVSTHSFDVGREEDVCN